MKTLIAYATKYGGTKHCAERLAKALPDGADLLALSKDTRADLAGYDAVIVGCSVYAGKPRKEAMAFCQAYWDVLLTKKLGLFLCCMQDLDKAFKQQMALAYPKPLQQHAAALGALCGVVDYTKLSFVDGLIMKAVAGKLRKKTGNDVMSTVTEERIDGFVKLFLE